MSRWAALSFVVVLCAGCHRPGERTQPSSRSARFSALFAQHCSGCHGAQGEYGPAVPLSDPLFLALMSDDALYRVISGGRQLMPAFGVEHRGPLGKEEIGLLIAGMRTRWGRKVSYPRLDETRAYLSSEHTPTGNPEIGEALFGDACAECHGAVGEGTFEAGPLNDPNLLSLVSDQLLRRTVITGRPDLDMPPFEKSAVVPIPFLEQASSIVAYVASWRRAAPQQDKQGPDAGSPVRAVTVR